MDNDSKSRQNDELRQLIEDCVQKKRKAQHRFFKSFYGSMFAVCMRYAENREEAEDMVLEGFVKIFDHLEKYQHTGSFEGWMKTIMINTAIDYQRKYKKMNELVSCEEVSEAVFSNAESNVISKMSSDELLKLVQELPPMSKNVFNLFVFDGFSHTEIADMLQIKEGTSFWHLNNARNILKEKIRKLYQI